MLFLTAHDAVSDRVAGLDGGADDYLCKPFAFEELLAARRALISRRRSSDDLVLSDRRRQVNLRRRAERAGQPLDLTAKELGLLAFFLRHPGETLARARLYRLVWGDGYDPRRTRWTSTSTSCAASSRRADLA